MMDVIYPYRSVPDDRDLRYSVRSLRNLRHRRVIVAGDLSGLSGVEHVRVERVADRYGSSAANILAALEQGASRRVIVMHDDIFIMRPWRFRHQDRGPIADYLASGGARGDYRQALMRTQEVLRAHGVDDPLFYSLHTPTVYNAARLREVIEEFGGDGLLLRTLYWNLYPRRSTPAADVKLREMPANIDRMPVISTSDSLSRRWAFRRWIAARFPDPSPYEVAV